jgi:ABC-type uncharacterized transport system ATPase subunit
MNRLSLQEVAMSAGTVVADGLTKVFHTVARRPGLGGALKDLVRPERVPKVAVDQVDSNGAGKSTTIKMLCGILTVTAEFGRARR